jgi:hypothetical protein
MNRQDIANLALRITGLYAILEAPPQLGNVAWIVSTIQMGQPFGTPSGEHSWLFVSLYCLPFATLLTAGLVLFFAAPALDRRLFPSTEHPGESARFLALHAFTYSVVGLYVTILGITSSASILFNRQYVSRASWAEIVSALVEPVVEIALGVALFFGSHGLVRIWSRLRYSGLRRQMNLCIHCAYDLTGNTSGTCPECGTTTRHTPAEPTEHLH